MPALKNARHERFAQELAKGAGIADAYKGAGYRYSPASATRLSKKVNARIAELKENGAGRTAVTLETLISRADDIMFEAREAEQFGAAVAALKELGVLTGLRVEHAINENTNVNYAVGDEPPSEEQWKRDRVTEH